MSYLNYFVIPGFREVTPIELNKLEVCSPEYIVNVVLNYFSLQYAELISKSRKRKYCYPRQCCDYLLRKKNNLFFSEIGKMIGDRDHTTIIHSVETIEDLMETDPKVKKDIVTLSELLK
jgi:chromosomal replication initiator protein